MTAVVETFRKIGIAGDLKVIVIQTSSACDSGHTIDLKSDETNAKGVIMTEVLNTLVQDDAGADEEATWSPSTGIITMGTLSATGIHNITIVGY